ncbi:MAG TPA: TRAM domain-containing protein [Gemmatimonadaceae bacterium]|nr:TRAM domain-containing protein [Gemmatimonadaceae bacterium]
MPASRVTIDSIAAGGDGVARADGFVVFVPRTAPGDVAEVEWSAKGRFGRGRVLSLEIASPVRVEPPCAHYVRDNCGGCQLQHMSYAAQLDAKGAIVRDALERIGKRSAAALTVRPSADEWRYRRKLTMALRRRGERWIAGLHPYDAPHEAFELRDCPITERPVLAAWSEVMAASDDLPRAPELRGAVRLGDFGISFILEGGTRWPRAQRFLESAPSLGALWWVREGAREPELVAQRDPAVAAAGASRDAAGSSKDSLRRGSPVANGDENVPGASFEQINARVALEMKEYVIERVLAHAPRTLVDGYSGAGDLAVSLSNAGVRVVAIELDGAAAARCGALLPPESRSIAARVEDALPSVLPSDVVVLNPPRRGVDERVTTELQERASATRAIVYVSCNPATLARDLARLPRWRIASLICFDMFPQTAHVETVCELIPEAA